VRNLRFNRQVTLAEITALCEGLGKRKEELAPYPDFMSWLASRGVEHIQADDIRYIDVKENERVVLRGKGQVARDESSEIAADLKENLNQIEKIPEEGVHDLLRGELAKELTHLAPEKLHELFMSRDAQSGPTADIINKVTESLPLNKIEDILRFAVEQHHQIKVQVQSQSDRTQRIALLKNFMRQVLRAPARREIFT
jgi:hypothetical protein